MSPIVLAMTGASALILGERSLKLLLEKDYEVSLILSKGAYNVSLAEQQIKIPVNASNQEYFWRERLNVSSGKLICHKWDDYSANIASGSYQTKAMVIVPCSMGTIGRIASGYSLDLVERCADVHLKERRKLIIAPRESPFSIIHLKNMTILAEAGVQIIPPIPAWYSNPKTLNDMIDFMVVRLFDSFIDDLAPINRWNG